MIQTRFHDPKRKCFIIRGSCFGCGKAEEPARRICFFDDDILINRSKIEPALINTTKKKRSTPHLSSINKSPNGIRAFVYKRDGHKCLACDSTDNLTLDHIIPTAQDGDNTIDNLQTLCEPCNGKKGNRIRDYRI